VFREVGFHLSVLLTERLGCPRAKALENRKKKTDKRWVD
jgi:hypothetical protein